MMSKGLKAIMREMNENHDVHDVDALKDFKGEVRRAGEV